MNSLVWSRFPSNSSGSAALVLWVRFCEVWTGILAWGFVAIACATVDAVAEATLVMSVKIRISLRNMSKSRKWVVRDVSKNRISDSEHMREWLRKPMRQSERARSESVV